MSDYFSDQIASGQPIVPPAPAAPEVPLPPSQAGQSAAVPPSPDGFAGLPVRAGGDRIFLLRNGKKHWITNPEAYKALGFNFGDEKKIDQATLSVLPEGEPIK